MRCAAGTSGRRTSPACGTSSNVHEFPKVGINCHQDAPICGSAFKQHPITRVRPKVRGLEDIMTLTTQPLRQTMTSTPVNEKPHGAATTTASSVSRAITACA
jgi:hypothetical protein